MGGEWTENGWEWTEGGSMMATAMAEAAASIGGLETEWDAEKLEQKLREYFRKGAKNLEFRGKSLEQAIHEYTDNAMGTLFSGIGDREWFTGGQVDLLVCLDAGIKDLFPGKLLKRVGQEEFEGHCLAAYERAFDEQRFWPLLHETVPAHVSGPKIKKKVQNAIDESRKEATAGGAASIEDFLYAWINGAVRHLSETNFGSPEGTVEPALFGQLLVALIEAGGLPLSLTQEGQEIPLDVVEATVQAAYVEHTVPDEPKKKKKKGAWQEEEEEASPMAVAFTAFGAKAGKGLLSPMAGKAGPYGKGGLGLGAGLGAGLKKDPYSKGGWAAPAVAGKAAGKAAGKGLLFNANW